MNFCSESDTFRLYGVEANLIFIMVFMKERPLVFVYNRRRFGLDCNLLGAIGLHYAHLRLGLGLVLGLGVGLALVFSET